MPLPWHKMGPEWATHAFSHGQYPHGLSLSINTRPPCRRHEPSHTLQLWLDQAWGRRRRESEGPGPGSPRDPSWKPQQGVGCVGQALRCQCRPKPLHHHHLARRIHDPASSRGNGASLTQSGLLVLATSHGSVPIVGSQIPTGMALSIQLSRLDEIDEQVD